MNHKVEEYLASFLFSLNGKITRNNFNKIVKFYDFKFSFKSIHIVGTNGKGSCAKYLNDELIANNYRVGLFTSPHINVMYERIKINDHCIDFPTFVKYTSDFQNDFPNVQFGFFDLFFLCALRWFDERQVDVAIFEAGIGAKKDVVNYLNHDISLITSISLDHEKILGPTLEAIAKDKMHAIKTNNHAYVSGAINQELINIFQKRAIDVKAKLEVANVDQSTFETSNQSLTKYVLQKEFGIKDFKSLFILPQGRAQKVNLNNFACYLDVAHNPEGILASLKYYEFHNIKFDQVVLSLSDDKNQTTIMSILKNMFSNIFVYQNKSKRAMKIYNYDKDVQSIISLDGFLRKINCPTLFIGSFYFISEILAGLNNGNNQSSRIGFKK